MSIEEFQTKLETIIKEFPISGFDAIPDSTMAGLNICAGETEKLGMKTGKEVLENLITALKTRKAGGNTDDSVLVRLTALEFYAQKLKDGTAEN
ncbi:MAG: hypothetical protein LBB72_01015 [Spirochaetaceae bacterium]|jgi:hypothetical protein|nr:hypothetical protein [Spirochaetaceae bacterium]